MKRNSAISILRVMAMSLIVFTHLCHLYNWVAIRALVFGVPLFYVYQDTCIARRQ